MAHTHPVVDSDSRFVINSTTREISTTSDKLELVQGDHQSERITFEIPKIVEGHDMSLSDRIEVHYINIERRTNATSRDVYIIDDAAVDGDKLTFSWLISGNATKYYGRLNFIILFECLDPDGNYTYKWNTEICKLLTIGEGISNTSAVIEDHSDILEKFKKEILEYVDSKQDMLIQSGASVGQIAKITAVDSSGKPTTWEAVDMPSGGGGQVQTDWNQNDSTAADYVKNRPFYTGDPVETVLIEEITVSFAPMDAVYIGQPESTFVPTVGETYKVSWDGTTYENTCVNFNNLQVIGNLSIMGIGSDTGEPFLIAVGNGNGIRIATADTSASHTFSISGKQTPIVKIPSKYIDKDTSGYIVVHKNSTMTEEDVQKYDDAILHGEAVFIIWNDMCINSIELDGNNLKLKTQSGETYLITKNGDGLFAFSDRKLYRATFPNSVSMADKVALITAFGKKVIVSSSSISGGVGSKDTLFQVAANGAKSKAFDVLGNGEAVAPAFILYSSTSNSTKKFRITVDDSGTLKATEVK